MDTDVFFLIAGALFIAWMAVERFSDARNTEAEARKAEADARLLEAENRAAELAAKTEAPAPSLPQGDTP